MNGRTPRRFAWFGGLALLVPLASCNTVTRFQGLPVDARGTYLTGILPVRQGAHHGCGGACVAAVAAHWNVPLETFNRVLPETPADTTPADLVDAAHRLGLQAFAYQGSDDDLRDNLRKGRPLIVMLPMPLARRGGWVGNAVLGAWNLAGPRPSHWVVAMGMLGDRIILHDPASGALTVPAATFQRWWETMDRRCVLIVPAAQRQ